MTDDNTPPRLHIHPPLFNSANPWATTLDDLRALYKCPSTGAVTTRTALLETGFPHDDAIHRYSFFSSSSPSSSITSTPSSSTGREKNEPVNASINTLGYSPYPLSTYLSHISTIVASEGGSKPFIVSVTGSPSEVAEAYRRIVRTAREASLNLAMEVNLSCPNIPGSPPPAYTRDALDAFVRCVADAVRQVKREDHVPWGVKTPPYTYADQFSMLVSVLAETARTGGGVSFVTAVNTLGSCLVVDDDGTEGIGMGGVAGTPVHALALGNVRILRKLLDERSETRGVMVLGIGGVGDAGGYRRMRRVGASAVGVGTALGIRGVGVFGEIEKGLGGRWEIERL